MRNADCSVSACFDNSGSSKLRILKLGTLDLEKPVVGPCSTISPKIDDIQKFQVRLPDTKVTSLVCAEKTAGTKISQPDNDINVKNSSAMDKHFRTGVMENRPSEIDPFGGMGSTDITRHEYSLHLSRWHPYWTKVLDSWKSSFVVRKTGKSGDKYWHPPGTSVQKRWIRSAKDLRSYLEYCVTSGSVNVTCIHDHENKVMLHENLLNQWKIWVATKNTSKR